MACWTSWYWVGRGLLVRRDLIVDWLVQVKTSSLLIEAVTVTLIFPLVPVEEVLQLLIPGRNCFTYESSSLDHPP